MDRFVGRVALVTGVTSGIGQEIAKELVRAGLEVVGVGRRQERLEKLTREMANEKGKLHTVAADLSREEDVSRVYKWIDDNLGGVSIVVNNAAVLTTSKLHEMDATTIQQLVNTNLTSVMLSCREAIRNMMKHKISDGHIVNINSIAGHQVVNLNEYPIPFSIVAYSATKHAITALCKGLRFDTQKEGLRTRITSISPGGVNTEMVQSFSSGLNAEDLAKSMPMSEDALLKVSDVSNAVLYVLSCPAGVEITELTIRPTGEAM